MSKVSIEKVSEVVIAMFKDLEKFGETQVAINGTYTIQLLNPNGEIINQGFINADELINPPQDATRTDTTN